MKIALIGYGKMGKAIEAIALQRGHTIGLKIDAHSQDALTKENLQQQEVGVLGAVPPGNGPLRHVWAWHGVLWDLWSHATPSCGTSGTLVAMLGSWCEVLALLGCFPACPLPW